MLENENDNIAENTTDNLQTSIKHKQKERHIRKKRKRQRRIKALLRFVIILVLCYIGYEFYMLKGWYLPENAYSNQNSEIVEIVNNKIIPTQIIYDSIKNVPVSKRPIFITNINNLKHEIYKIPVIDNVYIRRYGFPARLQIIIQERTPLAIIKKDLQSKPDAYYTTDGVAIINKNYMNIEQNAQTINILAKYNNDWNFEKIKEIVKIVKSVENYSSEKVEYIDMRNPNDVYVKIQTTNIRLGVLDSTILERVKRIYTILPQISTVDGQIKYIDLSWDKVNYLKMNK